MAPASSNAATPDDPSPSADDRDQHELAKLIEARLERRLRDAAAPAVTIVGYDRGRAEVLARDDRPEQRLLGFVLPDRFEAVAVFSPSVISRRADRRHTEAMLAVAVSRSGATMTRIATPGEPIIAASSPEGWVVDACLRSVGLPTAPIALAPVDLLVTLWLDRLMVAILAPDGGQPLTWPDAVDLCPLADLGASLRPAELGVALASSAPSWRDLRRATASGKPGGFPIPCEWAAWMDDGMFARWCLGYFPDLASLRADVEFLAPGRVAEAVAEVVAIARQR